LIPSAVSGADFAAGAAFCQNLSVALALLLIASSGLGMLFSLKTHRELFAEARSTFNRAFGACMEGKGYTIK
jgi:Ca2+:H+ antiporter